MLWLSIRSRGSSGTSSSGWLALLELPLSHPFLAALHEAPPVAWSARGDHLFVLFCFFCAGEDNDGYIERLIHSFQRESGFFSFSLEKMTKAKGVNEDLREGRKGGALVFVFVVWDKTKEAREVGRIFTDERNFFFFFVRQKYEGEIRQRSVTPSR